MEKSKLPLFLKLSLLWSSRDAENSNPLSSSAMPVPLVQHRCLEVILQVFSVICQRRRHTALHYIIYMRYMPYMQYDVQHVTYNIGYMQYVRYAIYWYDIVIYAIWDSDIMYAISDMRYWYKMWCAIYIMCDVYMMYMMWFICDICNIDTTYDVCVIYVISVWYVP